jgi:hypothetical protein
VYAEVSAKYDMKAFDLPTDGGQDGALLDFAEDPVRRYPSELFLRYRTQSPMLGQAL